MANDDDHREPDQIDLSLEDLEEEPVPAATGLPAVTTPATSETLVIETSDLLDISEEPGFPPPGVYPPASTGMAYPPAEAGAYATGKSGKKSFVANVTGAQLLQMLIAGALGGLLAWAINEPLTSDHAGAAPSSEVFLSTMIFFAIAGGAIGLFLGGVEGLSTFNIRKAALGAAVGLGIGTIGGGLAGLLGQAAYGVLGGRGDVLSLSQIFARTVGWAIAGMFIGLGQGVLSRSTRKIINALAGGALGGFTGGMLFDPIGVMMAVSSNPGLMSRLVALVVIGAASGAAIGLIEELRKQAWLHIVGGPLTGKQFILYNAVTTIGSSPKSDIALLKDPGIAPQHCAIEVVGAGYQVRDLDTQTGTFVNGRPAQRQPLRKGDVIQIGQTALEYQDRALTP